MFLVSNLKNICIVGACILGMIDLSLAAVIVTGLDQENVVADEVVNETIYTIEELEMIVGMDTDGINRYYYSELNDEEKFAYLLILKAQLNMDDYASIPYLENYSDIWYLVKQDYPEIFWVYHFGTIKYEDTISIYIYYNMELDEKTEKQELIENAAVDFFESVEDSWSDYEKVKFTYEYIAGEVDYVYTDNDQNIYGALVEGEAICAGYSRAMQYLLNRIGIDCSYVSGANEEISHAWNMVKIDGEYYYLDVTNGDDDIGINYGYMILSEDYINTLYSIKDYYYGLQEVNLNNYNYSYFEGYCIEEYNEDEIEKVIGAQVNEKNYIISFTDSNDLPKALNFLIKVDEQIFSILKSTAAELGDDELYNYYEALENEKKISYCITGTQLTISLT